MFWRRRGDCGLMVRFPRGQKKEQGDGRCDCHRRGRGRMLDRAEPVALQPLGTRAGGGQRRGGRRHESEQRDRARGLRREARHEQGEVQPAWQQDVRAGLRGAEGAVQAERLARAGFLGRGQGRAPEAARARTDERRGGAGDPRPGDAPRPRAERERRGGGGPVGADGRHLLSVRPHFPHGRERGGERRILHLRRGRTTGGRSRRRR